MGKIINLYQTEPIQIPPGENILVTGTYNILMAHHVKQFQAAKSIADKVIVASNSSESMAKYKPGNIQVPEQDRLTILTALSNVDYACLFNSIDAADALNILGEQGLIKMWGKGADYTIDKLSLEERTACDKYGIQIVFTPLFQGMSTSELIRQIREGKK